MKLSLNDTTVEVNAEHYEKLRHLFKLQTSYAQSGWHNDDENNFVSAAFALLCRYTVAQGGTFNTVAGHHAGCTVRYLTHRDGMGVDRVLCLTFKLPLASILQSVCRHGCHIWIAWLIF